MLRLSPEITGKTDICFSLPISILPDISTLTFPSENRTSPKFCVSGKATHKP